MMRFGHENLRVSDLEAAIRFYEENFGLTVRKRLKSGDGSAMAWLGYADTADFFLELTEDAVAVGSNHIAFVTDGRESWHQKHQKTGLIDYEIEALGIYFMRDPDGNSIEIMPEAALAALAES